MIGRKPEILNVVNSEHALWLQIEPTKHAIYAIDMIVRGVDEEVNGILQPKEHTAYEEFVPRRFSHFTRDGLYAMSIFEEDSIDFILLKDHFSYPAVGSLVKKYFDITDDVVHLHINEQDAREAGEA